MKLEFQRSHDQIEIHVINKDSSEMYVLTPEHTNVIDAVLAVIKNDYPRAYEGLRQLYSNAADFKFLMVRRFLKCNLGISDTTTDFDGENFRFEDVICPMRGECPWDHTICRPEFNTELSKQETIIAVLVGQGLSDLEIATKTFKSIFTVQNQIKRAYKKLGISDRTSLALYANKNLINNENNNSN
jgi:DNA-binding CsgD family transcriptional regulator